MVRVFRHNDLTGLKELLRAAIRDGQERTVALTLQDRPAGVERP